MFGIDPRAARASWTVLVVAAFAAVTYFARETLFILVLAAFLAYLLLPPVHFLQRCLPKLPRPVAVGLVILVALGLVAAGGMSLGTRIADQATALSERLPALVQDPHLSDRIPLPAWMEPLRNRLAQTVREQFPSGENQAGSFVRHVGMYILHIAGNVLYLVVIPILGFMLLKDGERMRRGFLQLIPDRQRTLANVLLDDLNTLLARYVRALVLLSIATFCAYALALELLDVPYSLVIAAIAGPLEFIPVLGPLSAAGIALLVAAFSGYPHLLWIAAFLLVYRIFQDYLLSPHLMSEGIELHPVIVIAGILAGEQIGGIPGMFLAIPILAAAKIIIQRVQTAAACYDAPS